MNTSTTISPIPNASTGLSGPTLQPDFLSSLQERLSASVKRQFMELLPDDQLDAVSANVMDTFLLGSPAKRLIMGKEYVGGKYVETSQPNPKYDVCSDADTLPGMIMIELKAKAKESVIAVLSSPPYSGMWKDGSYVIVEGALANIVKENADAFVGALVGRIVQESVMSTVNSLRNSGRSY